MQALLSSLPIAAATTLAGAIAGIAGGLAPHQQVASPPTAAVARATYAADEIGEEPGTATPSAQPHRVTRAADGMFYVKATVNGRPIRFLVDTGANVTVLRASDAAAVGAATGRHRLDARLRTAGGATAMGWTRLDEVRIAGRRVRGLRAAVVGRGLGVSLLGQNMLSRLASVTISGDELVMR